MVLLWNKQTIPRWDSGTGPVSFNKWHKPNSSVWYDTGIIITVSIICHSVECRQVIEKFIDQFMVFRGGCGVKGGSGRRSKTEVFEYLAYYLLVSDKANDLHPVR